MCLLEQVLFLHFVQIQKLLDARHLSWNLKKERLTNVQLTLLKLKIYSLGVTSERDQNINTVNSWEWCTLWHGWHPGKQLGLFILKLEPNMSPYWDPAHLMQCHRWGLHTDLSQHLVHVLTCKAGTRVQLAVRQKRLRQANIQQAVDWYTNQVRLHTEALSQSEKVPQKPLDFTGNWSWDLDSHIKVAELF